MYIAFIVSSWWYRNLLIDTWESLQIEALQITSNELAVIAGKILYIVLYTVELS